jgi:hypothetical protein
MAKFPQVDSQFHQERAGVNAIARLAANLGLIWRENQIKDVGIDGQIEYVTPEGHATGRLVAVQVKSGKSYFKHEEDDFWKFYPEEKHRLYWERFPIPVILVLHNPTSDQLAWIDVRQVLRSGVRSDSTVLKVPKARNLTITAPEELFVTSGVTVGEFTEDLRQVMSLMIGKRFSRAEFPLSYFELFVHGLTNIVRSLYFGMDLATTVVEGNLAVDNAETGMGLGKQEYDFLFDYIKFLVSQDLATLDFGDCLIDWNDRMMVPSFLAPLTSRGRRLVEIVGAEEDRLRSLGALDSEPHLRVAQERFLQILFTSTDAGRIHLVRSFETQFNRGTVHE